MSAREVLGLSRSELEELSRRRGDPEWVTRRRLEAYDALERLPPDPVVDEYVSGVDPEEVLLGGGAGVEVTEELWELAVKRLGIRPEELRQLTGYAVTVDNVTVEAHLRALRERGVVLAPMDEAVKRYDVVKEYMLRIMRPDTRLAAYHAMLWAGGVFVYVPRGVRIPQPLYGVFLITGEGLRQTEHTLIVLEEGASLTWVEGCTAPIRAKYSVHLGGLEARLGAGSRLTLYSVENWAGPVHHRPVKRFLVERGASLTATPIALGGATIVVEEVARLAGPDSSAKIQSVTLLTGDRWAESRLTVVHEARARSEVLARAVVKDRARDRFVGRIVAGRGSEGSVGRMACNTLLLSPGARSEAIPSLVAEASDVELSHEASVGRLSAEKLYYLRSMGFSEDEAASLLVQGFFEPVFQGLPFDLAVEVRRVVELALRGH